MRSTTRLLLCAFCSLSTLGSLAADETVYGAGVADARPVAIADLLARPDDFVGQRVRVEGRVDGVCPRRGCWIDVREIDGDRSVRFKVEDGEIVFPLEVDGKPVVAEGVFTKLEMSEDDALAYAKHLADEQGEPFDAASADLSTILYRIDGSGAVIGGTRARR